MRKFLLFASAISLAFSSFADAPVFQWGKLIDSPQAQDLSAKVVLTTDGSPVTLSQFGSKNSTDYIKFDDQEIATGAATTSNSENLNLLVIKHNASDGSLKWVVSSKNGDFAVSSAANMCATSDGGVLVLVNGRSTEADALAAPVLVDNSGAEVNFYDWNTSVRVYNQVLIRINEEGNIAWARNIAMDQLPVPNASATGATDHTVNGVTPSALAVDADGNIYIGGNYRAPMILTGDKNATYVLTARNIENYTGDTQSAAGGLYVIRLDKDGNYVNHLRATGALTRDQASLFCIDGSTLYIAGNVSGNVGDKLTMGEKSISMESTLDGFFVAGVTTDLKTVNSLTYIKPFANSSSTHTTKLRDLQLIGDNLYVVGGGTGGYGAAGSSAAAVQSTGKPEEGWFIALNPTNGSWVGAANNDISIGAYLNIFPYNNKIYVYGYRLNKETGAFLDEYEAGKFERSNRYTVAKGGGAPTAYSAAFDATSTSIYTLVRGNAAFTYGDDSTSAAPTSWGGLLATYKFNTSSSAISVAQSDESVMTAKGVEGNIVISATDDTNVVIVNAAGQTLASQQVKAGETNFPCSAGVYLVNNVKVVVK
jgi:hypothetical protein